MTEEHPPESNGLESSIESLLFVSDGPISIDDLARTFEIERTAIEAALTKLAIGYAARGIRVLRTRNSAQLVSAPEAAPVIQKFLGLETSARLSAAALETLAIIAYRQPVTRPQIESIRGVNSDGVMHSLLTRNLIQEVGRLETVGHPIQYGTTPDFLEYFGLTSFDEMPPLPEEVRLESETKDIAGFLRGRETGADAEDREREGVRANGGASLQESAPEPERVVENLQQSIHETERDVENPPASQDLAEQPGVSGGAEPGPEGE